MQLPFDQILGKNNPLKLPDVAAVEVEPCAVRGCSAFGDGMEKPKGNREVIHKSSDTFFIIFFSFIRR